MNIFAAILAVLAGTACWLIFLHRLDRNWKDKRGGHVIAAMVIAGCASIVPTWIAYDFNPFTYLLEYGRFGFHFFVVGVTEESVKFLVFIVMSAAMKSIREPQDGMVQGAAVGVGFAAVESIMYGAVYGAEILLERSVTIGVHALAGALWGYAWGSAVMRNAGKQKRAPYLRAFLSFIPVAFIHALYNRIWGLTAELKSLVGDERVARRIRGVFHSPEELIDQWMRRREELGVWG